MAAFNASVSEESRSRETLEDANRTRNQTGQCAPIQSPTSGTLKLEVGNGTSVGTVLILECDRNHVVASGGRLSCVQNSNITRWSGGVPECKLPLQYENGALRPRNVGSGFHLAVLMSIVSSAIIIFMSIIFITSCLLKHVKKDENRRMERRRRKENEAYWQKMDQQEMREDFYSHKGRNNNNNNNNNNSKPQQHHPLHQTAPNTQALTFKDQQTASRWHQQDYNLSIQPSRPPPEAMRHNSYMNTQTTFVLQPQLLTPRPSSAYNPTLEQSPWIHGSIPTPVVTQDCAFSGVSGQGLKDPFWKKQHSLDPNVPPIWVISV